MGTFSVDAEIYSADRSGPSQTITLMVDTGATYTCLPRLFLEGLGYRPIARRQVLFANGTEAEWEVTVITLSLQGPILPTLCFMAPDGSPSLLGAVTLEEFGLGVDPIGKRLIPAKTYLMQKVAPFVIQYSVFDIRHSPRRVLLDPSAPRFTLDNPGN